MPATVRCSACGVGMPLEGSSSAYMIDEATGKVLLLCEACRERPGLVPRQRETLHISHNSPQRTSLDIPQPVSLASSALPAKSESRSSPPPVPMWPSNSPNSEVTRGKRESVAKAVEWVKRVCRNVTEAEKMIGRAEQYLAAAAAGAVLTDEMRQCISDLTLVCRDTIDEQTVTAFGTLHAELVGVPVDAEPEAQQLLRSRDDILNAASTIPKDRKRLVKQLRSAISKGATKATWELPRAVGSYATKGMISGKTQKGMANLLLRSESQVPEEAMREWEYAQATIEEGDPNFPGQCEICHTRNVLNVYLIQNHVNGNTAWVGVDCLMNYTRPEGTGSVEDVFRRFNNQERERQSKEVIAKTISSLLADDDHKINGTELGLLHRAVCEISGAETVRDLRRSPQMGTILSRIVGEPWDEYSQAAATRNDAELIYAALFEPSQVIHHRSDRGSGYQGQLIGGNKRKVWTSLAKGEHTQAADRRISR